MLERLFVPKISLSHQALNPVTSGSMYKHPVKPCADAAAQHTRHRNTQAPDWCQAGTLMGAPAMQSPCLKADSAAKRACNMEAWEVHIPGGPRKPDKTGSASNLPPTNTLAAH